MTSPPKGGFRCLGHGFGLLAVRPSIAPDPPPSGGGPETGAGIFHDRLPSEEIQV